MATCDIRLEDKSLGGTYRFQFVLKKDGVLWTDADSVTLEFEKPDRSTTFTRSMVEGTSGTWYYDTVAADLDEVGQWTLAVRVVDSPVDLRYPHSIGFKVVSQP